MKYTLGIDFGGGASKATLLDENGCIAAENTVEYPTSYPENGWAEQNPKDWYEAARENIREVLCKSSADPHDIAAVLFDAATHTAVLCDNDFNVLAPSIYWTDTRSAAQAEHLCETYGALIYEKTLHKPSTIWTLPQLLWVKENRPEIWARVGRIMFAKDYVRRCLTGDFVTDYIEAEGSMLFDVTTRSWSETLCGMAGVKADMLPRIVAPTDTAGYVTAEAARDTGLAEGTRVLCGSTDTVMEVTAAGAVSQGRVTVKLATAGRICVITDKPYPDRDFVNYSHVVENLWYPGTATKSCAASYRWYRDTFGGTYEELDVPAQEIPIGCDGLLFHPYLNGELTPYADPMLCGSFTGIRSGHTRAHFSRAVLEGVALSLADCKKMLDSKNIKYDDRAVIIGGGSKSPLWRQITADVLGITLVQKRRSDSSLGSAMLAGVACGMFASLEDAVRICTEDVSVTEPNPENYKKYAEIYKKYKAVHDALAPVYHML